MRSLLFCLMPLLALCARGQNVDYHFQLLRTDPLVADALQQRLVQGGAEASAAIAKLGELIASKRIERVDELKLQAPSGQRQTGQSQTKMIKMPGAKRDVPAGLRVELEATVGADGGGLDMVMALEFADDKGKPPLQVKALSSINLASGQTRLVQRWDREKSSFLMLVSASIAGAKPTAGMTSRLVLVDATVHASEADARAGKSALTRVAYTGRSGNRGAGGYSLYLAYDADGGSGNVLADAGVKVEVDPVISADSASIQGTYSISCGELFPGADRMGNGDRVPKLNLHKSEGSFTLKSGEIGVFPCKVRSLAVPAAVASPRFIAIKATVVGP